MQDDNRGLFQVRELVVVVVHRVVLVVLVVKL